MKNTYHLFCFFTFCVSLFISPIDKAVAQAPANDDCSGAILVSTIPYNDMATAYTIGNTNGATKSFPDPSCISSGDNNDDVWYKFVAGTQTELLRMHTAVPGGVYTSFGYALYDGCGGREIACNNQMGTGYGNEMLGGLTPGNTYYLRFWSLRNFTFMNFAFAVMDISPQTPGDNPLTATQLSINSPGAKCIAPQFFTTASATRSSPNPSCNSDNDDDVWFQFICPANGVIIYPEEGALISTGGFANMGMEIIDVTAGFSASCIPNFGVGSTSLFSGTAGHVYQIRMWTMGIADRAVFSLCLQEGYGVIPSNDTCAAATALTVGSGACTNPVTGNLFNANVTPSLTGNPSCTVSTSLKNDVWYKATVPASGNLVVQTSATHSAVNDLILLAYTNNCTNFTQISCNEDGNPAVFPSANHSRISLTGRTPGEIIYFRVLPRDGNNLGQFSVCAFDETAAALPSISINDVKLNEGNSGTTLFNFTVSLSKASADTVKVKYKTVDITATANTDYVPVPSKQLLTFRPGETLKIVGIAVNGDGDPEFNESFKIKLSNAVNATIADSIGKGTIKNDDGSGTVTAAESENALSKYGERQIKIYPNPVTDKLNIELPLNDKACTITLSDIAGRIINCVNVSPNQGMLSLKMDGLSRGIYLVRIISGKDYQTFKVVKQ